MQKHPERLAFIDETSVKTNLTRLRGRSKRGQRLEMNAPFGAWGTQTFVAGLTHDSLIAPWVIKGAILRFDPLDLGWIAVEVNGTWYPAHDLSGALAGTSFYQWCAFAKTVMDHNRERTEISAEIYHDGLWRLELMSTEAAKTAQLGRMKFTVEEIDRAERTLGLGLHLLPAAPDHGSVASSNWLDARFAVVGDDPDDAETPLPPKTRLPITPRHRPRPGGSKMTNDICTSAEQVARVAVSLRKHFVAHPGYDTTLRLFHELMDKRGAELQLGLSSEGRGIAVIGESGSGKTTAVQRILRRMDLSHTEPGELRWISIRVPTPATQKELARAILRALKFPIIRDTTASRMWEMVHHHLQLRKCWLIHLDEGQELGGRGSETEKAAVINSLKSLMQIPDWPVSLIVSGTPELNDLLMQDPQLSRRFFVVRFLPVTEFDAYDEVRGLMAGYAGLTDLPLAPDLADVEFVPRLIHAGREQFGIVVELIIGAITRALGDGKEAVGLKDFARFYAERSGDVSARNPFLMPDFRSIPTGRAPLDPKPPTPPKGRPKKPRGRR